MTSAPRPDVVLFMTDQQRYDQLGYSSDGHFETPHLDTLAARGVVFENAYSASTTCVPARVALLTGLQPHRLPTQVNAFALREGFWTVARAMQSAGYDTALFGKMHFAPVHAEHGFETMRLCEHLSAQGLGTTAGTTHRDRYDDYHDWLLAQGLRDWRFADGDAPGRGTAGTFEYGCSVHPTGWIENEVVAFLERRDRGRPLFLVVSFPHPHAPYNPPEPYASMYSPADARLPATGFDVNERLPLAFQLAMTGLGGKPPPRVDPDNDAPSRRFDATVRGLVRHIDDAIGHVLDHVDLDATLVVFTSDHGDYGGNRGLLRKNPWLPFDDLARVPLAVAGLDVARGRRERAVVQSCDFALTCLDYAGIVPPERYVFETRSLRPLLEGAAAGTRDERAVFCATTMGWPMVRKDRFKYIRHEPTGTGALFDLERDPVESTDLSGDPGYASVLAELTALLDDEMRRPVLDPE